MEGSSDTTKKRKPPYGAVKWYEDFFNLLERVQIDKVDASLLETNTIASGKNVYSVINGLKFLDLIDEEGNATEKMHSLRVVGEEYEKNFHKIINEAYASLISKVEMEKALADDVINRFIRDHNMPRSTAKQATRVFVFLAQKAGISLSEQISKLRVSERPARIRRKKVKEKDQPPSRVQRKKIVGKAEGDYVLVPKGMHRSRWGDSILMFLRKGDGKTREKVARNAKRLIDMYVEEAEEEGE